MEEEEVARALTRIETKLDDFRDDMRDHEKRLRGMEKWQAQAMGVVAVVSAVITLGLQGLMDWVKGGAK